MGEWSTNYAASIGYTRPVGELFYIGRSIDLITLRNFILDKHVEEGSWILLHVADYAQLRDETAASGSGMPTTYLGVGLSVDDTDTTPRNRVQLLRARNDTDWASEDEDDIG